MKIANRSISLKSRPFIIAEMSGNHNQSLERALQLVDAAAKAGADALKLQTFTPETMTLDLDENEFTISDPKSLWRGQSIFSLYEMAQTPWDWHKEIFEYANKLGMLAFSSPFDESAIDFLESLNVPCYKIASFENTDIPLIRRAAATGKPLIISTGMATLAELDDSVRAARLAGCTQLALLKCTSTYPESPENSNVMTIPHMREMFNCEVGLSDHTMGLGAAVAAVSHGASLVEKHLTLDRKDGGIDSAFSLEPEEFKALTTETERAWLALGRVSYGPTIAEIRAVSRRRSIYIVKDIEAGAILNHDNLRCIRPGLGLPPKHLDTLIGKKVKRGAKRGTPVSWDLIY